MNEKDFFKQVSEYQMPDISQVKKNCIKQLDFNSDLNSDFNSDLKKHDRKKHLSGFRFVGITAIAMTVLCFCVMPENPLARNVTKRIRAILNLNESSVDIGSMDFDHAEKIKINIPKDCEKVEHDGITYFTKSYAALPDLIHDIQMDIFTWTCSNHFMENGILLNIVPQDYGRIALLYDFPIDLFVYFPLSADSSLGNIMLKNEQLKYSTIDGEGNIEKYQQTTEYELAEQFEDENLNTTVTIIRSNLNTAQDSDIHERSESDISYYLYFTLDGMCYQINCTGTLTQAHDILKHLEKTKITSSALHSSTNDKTASSDLLYRSVEGSVTLKQGEKIHILAANGQVYEDVYIILIGNNKIHKIGSLYADKPYEYSAPACGQYMIYAEKGKKNITNEVMIEHSCSGEDYLHFISQSV